MSAPLSPPKTPKTLEELAVLTAAGLGVVSRDYWAVCILEAFKIAIEIEKESFRGK